MTPATYFVVPMPPSVNASTANLSASLRAKAKANGKKIPGRLKTGIYRDWLIEAGWAVNMAKPRKIAGKVHLLFGFERPSERSDVTNRIKALEDLLVNYGIIEDDKHVNSATAFWMPSADKLAHVWIRPAADFSIGTMLEHWGIDTSEVAA